LVFFLGASHEDLLWPPAEGTERLACALLPLLPTWKSRIVWLPQLSPTAARNPEAAVLDVTGVFLDLTEKRTFLNRVRSVPLGLQELRVRRYL